MTRARSIVAATAALMLSVAAGHVSATLSQPPHAERPAAAPASPAPIAASTAAPAASGPSTGYGAPAASPIPSSPIPSSVTTGPPAAPQAGSPFTLHRHGPPKRSGPQLIEDFPRGSFHHATRIDNAYMPLTPGTRIILEGRTGVGKDRLPHRIEYTVTDLTRVIDGITSVVVHEVDFTDGELVEAEIIFYAQDDNGTVWLMGEYPEEYENGKIIDSPGWISGSRGSAAGILMQASPRFDTASYSEGWGPEVGWTDRARVLETGSQTCTRFKCFSDVLVTDEYNPDTPDSHQLKYYGRGVGNIKVGWAGFGDDNQEVLELTDIVQVEAAGMAKVRTAALALEKRGNARLPQVFGQTPFAQRAP